VTQNFSAKGSPGMPRDCTVMRSCNVLPDVQSCCGGRIQYTPLKLSFQIYIYNSTVVLRNGEEATATARQEVRTCGRPCTNFHQCQKDHPEWWSQAGGHDSRGDVPGRGLHPALRKHPMAEGSSGILPEVEPHGGPGLVRTPSVHGHKRHDASSVSEGFPGPYPQDRRPDLHGKRSISSRSLGQAVSAGADGKGDGILFPLKLSIDGLKRSK